MSATLEVPEMTHSKLERMFIVATFGAGLVAAYLMRRRGQSFLEISRRIVLHPFSSVVSECGLLGKLAESKRATYKIAPVSKT